MNTHFAKPMRMVKSLPVNLVIYGEPCSKANSRQLVTIAGRPAFIKSKKALAYVRAVQLQTPCRPELLEGRLRATIRIYYASERPDLDESVILDSLQGRIYKNDRQVRERHVFHDIDRKNPRAHVTIEEME